MDARGPAAAAGTPPPPPTGGPAWTGRSITGLSLHRRAPTWARLDTTPFVLLYAAVAAVVVRWSLSRFTGTFLAVVAACLHILALLAQHWSVAAHAAIAWRTVALPRSAAAAGVSLDGLHALVRPRPHRGKAELVPIEVAAGPARGAPVVRFHFQKRAYEYDPPSGVWVKATYPVRRPVDAYRRAGAAGLTDGEVTAALGRYGTNLLDMPAPSFMELYKQHLLAPFFVFQVACVGLWMLDEYWYYALMTLSMMLLFEGTVVFGRLRSLRELRGMRNAPRDILALRNSRWTSVSSVNLAPGDVVSLCRGAGEDELVPCDVLLLGGAAVVNEAMLTGESVPLMKEAVAPQSAAAAAAPLAIKADDKAHVLFGGTRILTHTPAAEATRGGGGGGGGGAVAAAALRPPDRGTVCYVLRTGFGSAQGRLMRTILFSTEQVSANSREAAFFLLFLLAFAIAASGYVLRVGLADADRPRFELLLHCVLIVTNVVPPELPMQLALAVNTSLIALARAAVFCTEPFRIPYAGKIDICCFDKTGTLTTDAIQAVGIALPPLSAGPPPSGAAVAAAAATAGVRDGLDDPELLLAIDAGDGTAAVTPAPAGAPADAGAVAAPAGDTDGTYPLVAFDRASREAVLVLAGCHSLVHVDDDVVGDPLELEALSAVQWRYARGDTVVPVRNGLSTGHGALRIVARHRFSSALQRMSVVAQVESAPGVSASPHVLVKGSPEAIRRLLVGGAPPAGYDETASSLARRGLRVLALAVRRLRTGTSVGTLRNMSRSDVESSLTFVGFVCFECPLRPDSRKAIRALKKSSHACTMITGDATLTAAHVARQVAISTRRMLILELTPAGVAAAAAAAAEAAEAATAGAAAGTPGDSVAADVCAPAAAAGAGADALTSDSGEELVAWMSAVTGQRRKAYATDAVASLAVTYDLTMSGPALAAVAAAGDDVWGTLRHVKVFARMTPALKERVLSSLNAAGLTTLMCGDGTNDVGALKQAHVGVALLSTTVSRPPPKANRTPGGAANGANRNNPPPQPQTFAEAVRQRQAAMVRQQQMAQLAAAQRAQSAQAAEQNGALARGRRGGAGRGEGASNGTKEVATRGASAGNGAAAPPKTELETRIAELQAALAEGETDGPPLVKLGDASVASPFTSKRMSIDSVAAIVRQGRCTLATTMQMYQILALNSLVSAYSLSVLHLDGVKLGDRQLTITGILAAAAFFMVSRSKPLRRLSRQRPAESVFSPALFLSLLGQFAMHVAALYVASSAAKRYLPPDHRPDVKGSFSPNILNTVVFLLSTSQQTATFVVNYKGRPFMEGLFDNAYLLRTLVVCAAIVAFTVAEVSSEVNKFMQLVAFPNSQLRWFVIRVLVVDSFGSLAWDRLVSRIFTRVPPVIE